MFRTTDAGNGSCTWEAEIEFAKKNTAQRLVYGVVYEPDVVDSQDDSASAEEIEKAAHKFMMHSRNMKIQHKEQAGPRVSIVESYVAHETFKLGDQIVRKGAWVMAVKIHDDGVWTQVEKGELTGFSMGGRARAA